MVFRLMTLWFAWWFALTKKKGEKLWDASFFFRLRRHIKFNGMTFRLKNSSGISSAKGASGEWREKSRCVGGRQAGNKQFFGMSYDFARCSLYCAFVCPWNINFDFSLSPFLRTTIRPFRKTLKINYLLMHKQISCFSRVPSLLSLKVWDDSFEFPWQRNETLCAEKLSH